MTSISRLQLLCFLWLVCSILVQLASAAEEVSCIDAGFNDLKLACSTCNKMEAMVKDKSVRSKCRQCCNEDHKYDVAVLEYDKRYLKRFHPEILAVVADKSLHIKMKNTEGARPQLLLFSGVEKQFLTGEKSAIRRLLELEAPTETISVANWKQDAIKDFIQTNVR